MSKLFIHAESVPKLTAGQAVTALRGREFITNDEPLLIHNADSAFHAAPAWIGTAKAEILDGALLVIESREGRWSYSRENERRFVVEVREKQVIPPWPATGSYSLDRGSDFVPAAEARLDARHREAGEFYVGPLYTNLIARGARIKNFAIRELYCFCPPDDQKSPLKGLRSA